ncbi:BTAD domain-containing putative transcriptional regulator [Amycolatopsis sp. NPDC059027]|uniref:AfsR/SARP family transcriptional regulator n=1 Tax=unclassified Amycolatopsis TaxID=2618356 RepID=UPI00366A852B
MDVRVLGSVEARVGGAKIDLGSRKQQFIFAVLALEANRQVSVERLVELTWGQDRPPSANQVVRTHISRLRRVLRNAQVDPDDVALDRRPRGYLLRIDQQRVDAHRFRAMVDQARMVDDVEAAKHLKEALQLWRGEPLAGLCQEHVRQYLCCGLHEARLLAFEDRMDLELGLGRHGAVLGELSEFVAGYPDRQRATAQLMLAHYRSGQLSQALDTYRRLRVRLAEQSGLDPSQGLQRLETAILRASPHLELPAGLASGAASAPRAAPRQLMANTDSCTGRGEELELLDTVLEKDSVDGKVPTVVITGGPGFGKTSLAVQWAHRVVNRFPDGQLWANLDGMSSRPRCPADVLAQFLRALHVRAADIPDRLEEMAATYRSLLADRRMLVVLDDAADHEQIRPLLPGYSGCAVVVTSRRRFGALAGIRPLELGCLDATSAVAMLGGIIGVNRVDAEPVAAQRVADSCGNLPLALRIAGTRLAVHPQWTIGYFADRLKDERRRLDELSDGTLTARASFTRTYRHLEGEVRGLFHWFGHADLPEVSLPKAARLLGCPLSTMEARLDALVDVGLLEVVLSPVGPKTARYRIHPLIRHFAREQAEATSLKPRIHAEPMPVSAG